MKEISNIIIVLVRIFFLWCCSQNLKQGHNWYIFRFWIHLDRILSMHVPSAFFIQFQLTKPMRARVSFDSVMIIVHKFLFRWLSHKKLTWKPKRSYSFVCFLQFHKETLDCTLHIVELLIELLRCKNCNQLQLTSTNYYYHNNNRGESLARVQ